MLKWYFYVLGTLIFCFIKINFIKQSCRRKTSNKWLEKELPINKGSKSVNVPSHKLIRTCLTKLKVYEKSVCANALENYLKEVLELKPLCSLNETSLKKTCTPEAVLKQILDYVLNEWICRKKCSPKVCESKVPWQNESLLKKICTSKGIWKQCRIQI